MRHRGWSMSKEKGRILKDAQAGDPVALARALVAIPSVNPALEESGAGEAAVAALTAEWLRAWGLSVVTSEVAPGRWNVVARLEGDGVGRTLLLNGHLDTVGVAGVSVDPFGAELREGRLWGRGSCDMKGGVAALLAATAKVARNGPSGALIVALTADEEHASLGMEALVRSGMRADAAVVCEPTSLDHAPLTRGSCGSRQPSGGEPRTVRGPKSAWTPSSMPVSTSRPWARYGVGCEPQSLIRFWVTDRFTPVRSTAVRHRPSIPTLAGSFLSDERCRERAQPTLWTSSKRCWTIWRPRCRGSTRN